MKNLIKNSLIIALMAITLAWPFNLKASTTISAIQIKNVEVLKSQQTSGGHIIYGRVLVFSSWDNLAYLPTSANTSVTFGHWAKIIGKYNGTFWSWINDATYIGIRDFGIDGNGDVYICGDAWNMEDVDMFITKLSGSDGSALWEKQEGTKGVESARAISIDANDNIYVGGIYSYEKGQSYYRAAYASKWTSSGTKSWSVLYDAGNDYAICHEITSDPSGNVYIIGDYSGKLVIGETKLSGKSNYQVFVAKINSSGTAQWATSAECDNNGVSLPSFIAADANGNVYISGWYGRDDTDPNITKVLTEIDFGNNISLSYSDSAGFHCFITKYNSSGTAQWAKKITGSNIGSAEFSEMFVSANNNLFMLWNATGAYNIAGTSYTADLSTFLITELNSSGTVTVIQPKAVNSTYLFNGSLSQISGGFIVSGVNLWGNVDLDDFTNISDYDENPGFIATYTDVLFKSSTVIEEKENEITGIKVYPNPANDVLFIESPQKNSEVCLTDLTGKVIIHTILSEYKAQIDLNGVEPGIYLLRAGSDVTKILIK